MRLFTFGTLAFGLVQAARIPSLDGGEQQRIGAETETAPGAASVPLRLFASLERYARIVDIAYCVGTTGLGIDPPFSCASRCADFPELRLVTTWNTGVLMHDSCGYVAVDEAAHEIVVAFRGTYSVANTVADLSTIPQKYVPYPGGGDDGGRNTTACANCTVHMGFLASWESARGIVLPVVADVLNASAVPLRIHLVGHSLGGAVAALAGLELTTHRAAAAAAATDVSVTTFGEPRIGNDELAAYLEGVFGLDANGTTAADVRFRRVTHKNDPVPLLPLDEWGYRPHAGEIYIAKGSLAPAPDDVHACVGRADPACLEGGDGGDGGDGSDGGDGGGIGLFPPRLKLWELFYAHRDYFWRLGLCLPGGDPADWGRARYNVTDESL